MTSKTKTNIHRHSNFDAAYKNVSDMCNMQNNNLWDDNTERVHSRKDKSLYFNSKLENLRRSNFDAAYKNVSDMCNVQNNDLDLPMRVYQKASKQKKNITHFMFWLLFTSPVASVLKKLRFIHFLTFPACF